MKLPATLLAMSLCVLPRSTGAAETVTARAGLKTAVAEARKWNHEATLASVGTSDARPDGTSTHWTYSFQAKTSRTCFRVVVLADGRTVTTDLGECTLATPVSDEFVDSPAALTAATAAGFKAGETINLGLRHSNDRNLNPSRACWTASSQEHDFDAAKAVMRGWCVDPASGKFVTRTAGESARGK